MAEIRDFTREDFRGISPTLRYKLMEMRKRSNEHDVSITNIHTDITNVTQVFNGSMVDEAYPYVLGWEGIGLSSISGLTITFPAIKVVFADTIIELDSWSYTFTQGLSYFVWVNHDGTIFYDYTLNALGGWDRYSDKCPLCQIATWPTTSTNTGIWTVWTMCDKRVVNERREKVEINLELLLNDYYIFPHTDHWAAGTFEYRDSIMCSDGRLYLVTRPGTITNTEPAAPTLTWEPYAYTGWGDQVAPGGTAYIRFIGNEKHEGYFRQGIIGGVSHDFGLEPMGHLARLPRFLSDNLAPYLWSYIKQFFNQLILTWVASTAYKKYMLVVGSYTYEGWIWEAQGDGTSDVSCAFLTFLLNAASFTAGGLAGQWSLATGWTGGDTLVHTGAQSLASYGTPITCSAGDSIVVSLKVTTYAAGSTLTAILGDETYDSSSSMPLYASGYLTTVTIVSPIDNPTLKFSAVGDLTLDDVHVYVKPVAGTTTVVDNDITWKCVGRTSYHTSDINYVAINWDELGTTVTGADSHDGMAWAICYAINQLRESGNLPDEFWFSNSNQHDITGASLTYYNMLGNLITACLINQFHLGNLCWVAQYGLYTNGSQSVYPFHLMMDSCGVYGAMDQFLKIISDPKAGESAATIAYYQAFKDYARDGIVNYWDDTNNAFVWALDDTGAQMGGTYYGVPSAADNPPAYPWVMANMSPALYNIPIGYDRMLKGEAFCNTVYPGWWKKCMESAPFLLGGHHIALTCHDYTDTVRNEIIDMVESEKIDTYSADPTTYTPTNAKFLQNLSYYLLLKYNRCLPFTQSAFYDKDVTGDYKLIASGVLALDRKGTVKVESETGTTDDLDQITGLQWGDEVTLYAAPTHTITVKKGTYLKMPIDFTLSGYDTITFMCAGNDTCYEKGRSANA